MLRVDLEGFNHKAPPPVTRAKMEMIYQGKTDLAAWVSDLKRDPDSVLQMDRCPMRGDLYTVQQLVSLAEAQGVSVYSANVLSRELTAAGFPPSQIISPFGTSVRARPVRNFEAWEMGRDWRSKWCAHWEETRAKSAGSKGGGGAKERKF
jgi:hypothetical protein